MGGRMATNRWISPLRLFALLWVSAVVPVGAAERWQCSNPALEVRCAKGQCSSASGDDFTPLSLTADTAGAVELCAYTGCWRGQARVLQVHPWLLLQASDLVFSSAPEQSEMRRDILFLLDPVEGLAYVRADMFAQPLYCSPLTGALK